MQARQSPELYLRLSLHYEPTRSAMLAASAASQAATDTSRPYHLPIQPVYILQALLPQPELATPAEMDAYNLRITELRKYVVLNYVACIKAVKKRNRHLSQRYGPSVGTVHASALLSRQPFFTSPKLAALQTQAEVLAQVCSDGQLIQRYLWSHSGGCCGAAGLSLAWQVRMQVQ